MNVLVVYESRSGRTKSLAEACAQALGKAGHTAEARALSEASDDDIRAADMLFVGSWVAGLLVIGVGPAKPAKERIPQFPSLDGKPCAVFCTYGLDPRRTLDTIGAWLAERGGWVVAAHAAHHLSPTAGAGDFVRTALEAIEAARAT